MSELMQPPLDDLPPLPDYWAPPEDPRRVAAPYSPELVDLYVKTGGDGLRLALAAPRNSHTRQAIGNLWMQRSVDLNPAQVPAAANDHFHEHFDIGSTGVFVPEAPDGMDGVTYARHMLNVVLLLPRREEDTGTRLRTRNDYHVPGTRFDDPFPADNVQVAMAQLADRNIEGAHRTMANGGHDTMRFGYPPNFSKLAMLRQQTPLDSFTVEAIRGFYGDTGLVHWRDALVRNIKFMQQGVDRLAPGRTHRRVGRLPVGLVAYRNWDDTPVNPKLRTVIRVESAAKDIETGERAIAGIKDPDERDRVWVRTQKSLAAGAESFQDMSDYQLANRKDLWTTRTIDIYTSWMQAAVAHKIKLAAEASEAIGDYHSAEHLWGQFNGLKQVVALSWRQTGPHTGHYTDLLRNGDQTGALNAAQLLPLLVGNDFVPYENALMSINAFREELLGEYGLHTSNILDCLEQWSGEIDWPSLGIMSMHAAMEQAREAKRRNIPGQSPEPFIQFAVDIQKALKKGILEWYNKHRTLPERIHGTKPTEIALGGEYCSEDENGNPPEPQIGFAMTAAALIVAETLDLRDIWEQIDPSRSWLSQCFAIHNLSRTAAHA